MFVGVGPWVGEVDGAGLGADVGESVEDVGGRVKGEVLRVVGAGVDGPVYKVEDGAEGGAAAHDCGCCRGVSRVGLVGG